MRLKDVQAQPISVQPVTRTMGSSIPDWQRMNTGNTTLSGSSRPTISQTTQGGGLPTANATQQTHPYSSKFMNILDAVNRKEPITGIRTDIVDKPIDPEAPITVKGTKDTPQKPYQKVEVQAASRTENEPVGSGDINNATNNIPTATAVTAPKVTEIIDTPPEKIDSTN